MKEHDPLAILFGSSARVKLLRLFLFNPSMALSVESIIRRARLVRRTARTELSALERAGLIKKKQVFETVPGKATRRRVQGYALDQNFPKLGAFQTFLFDTAPLDNKTVLRHLRKAGKLDLVVVTGVFMREFDRRLDLIVASSKLEPSKVEAAVRTLEAEIGIEIRYANFASNDFMYRLGMYDKLTRDVFDYPHQLLVDKIGVRDELLR